MEYNIKDLHFTLFGGAITIKIISFILLIIFSILIHKSFLLKKKYRDRVSLNHDPNTVHSSRKKKKIDSEVASLDSFSSLSTTSNNSKISTRNRVDNEKVILKRFQFQIDFDKHDFAAASIHNDKNNYKTSNL